MKPLLSRSLVPLLAAAGTTFVLLPSASAQSDPPAHALLWTPPEAQAQLAQIERLASRLTPWGQLDAAARIGPLLRYQDYPGDGEEGELTARMNVSAQVDFADRPSTHARSLQTLQRARERLRLLRLRGTRDALLAHAELLIAQEKLSLAEAELVVAETELAITEAALNAVQAELQAARAQQNTTTAEEATLKAKVQRGTLEHREAQLEHGKAQLDKREALFELEVARWQASEFGLAPAAHWEPLLFVLPPKTPGGNDHTSAHEYLLLELELAEARAELAETLAGPLDDLRVRAAYRLPAMEVDLEGGIVNGQPGANLGLALPGGNDRWQLEISAQLVLDRSLEELPQLEQEVELARSRIDEFPRMYQQQWVESVTGALLAQEALALASREVAMIEAEATTNEMAGAQSERRLSQAKIRLYRAWIAYIRAVGGSLEVSGGDWLIANE